MARFDVAAAVRLTRRDPGRTLARRADDRLPFVSEDDLAGQALLLDTCVYIDQLQGRAPLAVKRLLEARHVHHSTVAIQELLHTVGALDPADARTPGVVQAIEALVSAMPEHRTIAPDVETLGRAAVLTGMLSRRQGYARGAKLKALQDCTLFLQAYRRGLTVLTANLAEFDLLLQLFPEGRALFYRQAETA